ncbi:MAG TPA: ComEC/Rec2 family competence protein [Mesorhizobium sp.]|nr:ComEC/Rec2 family competence protein [Mesorhizobium sp.]
MARRLQTTLELERERGALYLCVPIALGAGAIAYFTLPVEPPGWSILGLLLLACGATWASRGWDVSGRLAATFLLVVLGVAAAKFETWRASTKMLGAEVTTTLTGRVAAIDPLSNGRTRLTLDVLATDRPKLRYAPERVRVSTQKPVPGLNAGSTASGVARLMPPSGPVRPGGYDFSFESYFDGLGGSGFFMGQPRLLPPDSQSWSTFAEQLENFRNAVAARIRDHIPGAEGEIAAALVVGVRAGIPEEVNEHLRLTGLAHVLSISGLHMALVAATVMGGVRGVLALFASFAARHAIKKHAAVAALVVASAYLLISGAEVAAQRSFIMLAVILLAVICDRTALTMRNLATAAILILLWSPHEIMGPSFQMSFAATAALIAAYGSWTYSRRATHPSRSASAGTAGLWARRGARALVGLGTTSLVAGAATLVFGAYHFHRMSPLSLPANLLAMPVISLLVMPFAVIGMLAMPFGLDGPFWRVMGFGLDTMLKVAERLAELSPSGLVGTVPVVCLAAVTAAILLATIPTSRLRFIALFPAIVAAASFATRSPPDILIAEDGRLVGMRGAADTLAMSRPRPNAFTAEVWLRATASTAAVALAADSPAPLAAHALGVSENGGSGFHCAEGLCWTQHASGARLAIAETAGHLRDACLWADFLVVSDPTERKVCGRRRRGQVILTGRELARLGSASVHVRTSDRQLHLRLRHAIDEPFRPWHQHRRFSRAARGLEERSSAFARPTHAAPAD